jgi:hypothetical protein
VKRLVVHVIAGLIVGAALALAYFAPERYDPLMEEDRAVEWATVALYLAAAIVRGYHAVQSRRIFDGLVALFCLFVAGEEISWGQRLIGYIPPAAFLEHNTQQETNIHNFADVFGRPKWMLILALAGFGLLLPALARATSTTRRLLERAGATAPAPAFVPWFLAAVALLIWYPVTFTGEWVELLSGWLFLASAPLSIRAATAVAIASVPLSLAMTSISAARSGSRADGREVACARAEVAALLADLVEGGAATEDLATMSSVHKRVWGSVASGYVDDSGLRRFRATPCEGGSLGSLAPRRRYAVDPWGTAYWMHVTRDPESDEQRFVVYSFGPNRRRDGEPGETTGDDVAAQQTVR